jgi:licheninase
VLAAWAVGEVGPAPQPTAVITAAADTHCPTTAARRFGWGDPTRSSDFGTGLPPDWHPHGPEVGHDKRGVRTPAAFTVNDGVVTITGTADGTTGAMSWHPGQRYGRWEACVRMDPGPDALHGVLILWPVAEDFPAGGEIDWMEVFRGDRQEVTVNIHHGPPDRSFGGTVARDGTRWTGGRQGRPTASTYADGEEWYSTDRSDLFPPRPRDDAARLVLARRRRPAERGSAMRMDWAHQWHSRRANLPRAARAPGDPRPKQTSPTPTAGRDRCRRHLTRGRRVTKRIWGRHPPPTTRVPAPAVRRSGTSRYPSRDSRRSPRVGGSAPRREQVIAAASTASCSSSSSVL